MQKRHQDEHSSLEEEWTQPHMIRKFDKRSPALLQGRQREQYMLLAGMYEEADEMKQLNKKREKLEIADKEIDMKNHFLIARSQLIQKQQQETNKALNLYEDSQKQTVKERQDLDIKTKVLEKTQRNFDNESDFNRYAAKKYKRPGTSIMPTTVMTFRDVGDDIPPLPKGKFIPRSIGDMMQVRSKPIVTPLPLRPISVKQYKPPKIRYSK